MFSDFDQMADTSRIWIYQAAHKFTKEQEDTILQHGHSFCDQWEAHGVPLMSSIKVFYNQFIVIAVDEGYNNATGCSIDRSVALMQALEKAIGSSLFDRSNIAFLKNGEVFIKPLQGIKSEIASGEIHAEMITFNNLVKNVGEMKEKWQVQVGNSWLKRYFA